MKCNRCDAELDRAYTWFNGKAYCDICTKTIAEERHLPEASRECPICFKPVLISGDFSILAGRTLHINCAGEVLGKVNCARAHYLAASIYGGTYQKSSVAADRLAGEILKNSSE